MIQVISRGYSSPSLATAVETVQDRVNADLARYPSTTKVVSTHVTTDTNPTSGLWGYTLMVVVNLPDEEEPDPSEKPV